MNFDVVNLQSSGHLKDLKSQKEYLNPTSSESIG
jgi:hypothetical protein